MAQWVRVLAVLAEDLKSVSELTLGASREFNIVFWPFWALQAHGVHRDKQAGTRIHIR